jgi:hypothetical protein
MPPYPTPMAFRSFRTRLRAFQKMRCNPPDPGFLADLEFLENRDLDLSVRLGGMLAFNALLITIGTHPVSASPGAPLSLDAASQPELTLASLAALLPLALSSWYLLRAMLLGEEIENDELEDDALRQHLFAVFVHSIDVQARLLTMAIRGTLVGAGLTMAVWAVILWGKMGAAVPPV